MGLFPPHRTALPRAKLHRQWETPLRSCLEARETSDTLVATLDSVSLLSFWLRNLGTLQEWLYPSPGTEKGEITTESSDKKHLGRNQWEGLRSTPLQHWDLLFACGLYPWVVELYPKCFLSSPHTQLHKNIINNRNTQLLQCRRADTSIWAQILIISWDYITTKTWVEQYLCRG